MSDFNVSPAAESAREQARNPDGRFGNQATHTEPDLDLAASMEKSRSFAAIDDPETRIACVAYAERFAPAPDSYNYQPDWDRQRIHAARDLRIGHRLPNGSIITSVNSTRTPGVVYVHTDGHAADDVADGIHNHGDPVTVHADRVDLSDPDWFAVEANRITTAAFDARYVGTASQEEYDVLRTDVRRALTRAMQPNNISPLHHDDARIVNGRAKVGDNVVFEQPMTGSTAYEVLGKCAGVNVTGHDGTNVTWAETGAVEYVLKDLATGTQQRTEMTGPGWHRIPAPADVGPGAQEQAVG